MGTSRSVYAIVSGKHTPAMHVTRDDGEPSNAITTTTTRWRFGNRKP